MANIHMLIGLPAVGKSTYVKETEHLRNAKLISSDAYIEEQAAYRQKTYNELFEDLIKNASAKAKYEYYVGLEENVDMVIDRTNMSRKSRQWWIDLAKKEKGNRLIAYVFWVPGNAIKEHETRLAARPGKDISKNVIERMKKSYQAPQFDEGFHEIYYVDTFNSSVKQIER